MVVYNACVISTLLHGSEAWTTYAKQEKRLNSFDLRCLRRILGTSQKDKVPTTEVLSPAGLPSMFTLFKQRRLRWLGHVNRMEDRRIPNDMLYGELAIGKGGIGRPQLQFRDFAKETSRPWSALHWEDLASHRSKWRSTLTKPLKGGKERLTAAAEEKETAGKTTTVPIVQSPSTRMTCTMETATHVSVSLVTAGGAVPAEQTARKRV